MGSGWHTGQPFLQGFLANLGLEPFLGLQLLQPQVLFFQFCQVPYHEGVHAAELGSPFIKLGRDHAMFATKVRDGDTLLILFEDG
jgi:hypothetical protein